MRRLATQLALAIAAGAFGAAALPGVPPAAAPSFATDPGRSVARPADVWALGENRNVLQDLVGLPLTGESLGMQPPNAIIGNFVLVSLAVECALRDDQSVTVDVGGTPRTVSGRYRMYPRWADGPCDEECQEWVSACMLAKINGYGVPVRLYFNTRSDHPDRPLSGTPQDFGYHTREGAFYGNFFASPPRLYACRADGRDPLYDTFRICTHPGSACKIQAVGSCLPTSTDPSHACEEMDADGVMRNCRGRLAGDDGVFPADAHVYDRVVTTYLPRSALAPGLEADACIEGPGPEEPAPFDPPTAVGAIGDACETDDDCNAPDLVCDHLIGGIGICTRGCVNTRMAPEESAMCGDDHATCARGFDDWERCAQKCVPRSSRGPGCPDGQACTAYHLFTDFISETSACLPFCQSDDQCDAPLHCHPRDGECHLGLPNDGGLPDGEPCRSLTNVCRGQCIPIHGYEGICGSYIDLGAGSGTCPDPPITPVRATGDDLALCVFKPCTADADCTSPLACAAGRCSYP